MFSLSLAFRLKESEIQLLSVRWSKREGAKKFQGGWRRVNPLREGEREWKAWIRCKRVSKHGIKILSRIPNEKVRLCLNFRSVWIDWKSSILETGKRKAVRERSDDGNSRRTSSNLTLKRNGKKNPRKRNRKQKFSEKSEGKEVWECGCYRVANSPSSLSTMSDSTHSIPTFLPSLLLLLLSSFPRFPRLILIQVISVNCSSKNLHLSLSQTFVRIDLQSFHRRG